MNHQRLIGVQNTLPWKLPADMKWFRQHTLNKPIIMGRKTYQSFGSKALPQRTNIVISADPEFQADDAIVTDSLEQAISKAGDVPQLMIIGGASVYAQALDLADKLYMTIVDAPVEGDAWFPEFDTSRWKESFREDHSANDKNPYDYSFVILERTSEKA